MFFRRYFFVVFYYWQFYLKREIFDVIAATPNAIKVKNILIIFVQLDQEMERRGEKKREKHKNTGIHSNYLTFILFYSNILLHIKILFFL